MVGGRGLSVAIAPSWARGVPEALRNSTRCSSPSRSPSSRPWSRRWFCPRCWSS